MKITSAEFVKSAFERSHWVADRLPEVAFLGRSNVGKSSLINSLLSRKGLARTSNTPGRTQSINFFLVNDAFYFVDLPGYGFASVSKTMRESWGEMAESYLSERTNLALCVQLIDARHPPSRLDLQLNEWLKHRQKPRIAVATKSDKLSNNELRTSVRNAAGLLDGTDVVPYSAKTGRGREDVWAHILGAISKS